MRQHRELLPHEGSKRVFADALVAGHGGRGEDILLHLDIAIYGFAQGEVDLRCVWGFEAVFDGHSLGLGFGFGGARDGHVTPIHADAARPRPAWQLPRCGRGALGALLPHLPGAAPLAVDAVGIDLAAAALILANHPLPPLKLSKVRRPIRTPPAALRTERTAFFSRSYLCFC